MHMDIEMANDLISCTTDWTNDYTCADTVIISNGCLKRCSYCAYSLIEKNM